VWHLSGSQWVVYALLEVLWAVLGYRLSENVRRRYGRTLWGLPSWVWALFWVLSPIIGFALFLIAYLTGARRTQQHPPVPGGPTVADPVSVAATARPSASDLFPAYPRPANAQPAGGDPAPPSPSPPVASGPPAPPVASPMAPPGWHPDPGGRFHYRWWDGRQWTAHVSLNGQQLVDTNPDQRIGPY
jgi:Protein of unknown function (DUF2510)